MTDDRWNLSKKKESRDLPVRANYKTTETVLTEIKKIYVTISRVTLSALGAIVYTSFDLLLFLFKLYLKIEKNQICKNTKKDNGCG